ECVGVNKSILFKLLNNSEYENLKEKMRKYFSYFIFYPKSELCLKNLETLERCSNFFSMRPFIDVLFFERLVAFAQDGGTLKAWKILLKVPEYADQAAE